MQIARRPLLFLGVFLALTALSFAFPPFNSDSVRYSKPGNVFALQWLDYTAQSADSGAFHNGRYFAHIILRTVLQWGEPWLNLATSFFIIGVLFIFCKALKTSSVTREREPSYRSASALLCTLLLMVNLQGPFALWFIHAHLIANYVAMAFLLAFFIPYARLAGGGFPKISVPLPLFMALGLLAGNAHEQAAAGIPLLLLLALYLRPKNLPRWYWLGAAAYAVGLIIVLIASGSPQRLAEYGGVKEWEFFGQKLNWLDLGWQRYLYSFVCNYLCNPLAWFLLLPLGLGTPLWLALKRKNPSHPALGQAGFYGLLGVFFAGIMVAGPWFKDGPHGNSLVFLLLALGTVYYHSLREGIISQKTGQRLAVFCIALLSASALILAAALAKPAANYRRGRALVIEASRLGQSTVTVPGNTTVDLPLPNGGRLQIPYIFEYTPFLLERYGLDSIVITNGESRTLSKDQKAQ